MASAPAIQATAAIVPTTAATSAPAPGAGTVSQSANASVQAAGKSAPASQLANAKNNAASELHRMQLEVHVDDATHEVVMKISDPLSGQVIYQVPSNVALDIAKQLESQGYQLLDRKA